MSHARTHSHPFCLKDWWNDPIPQKRSTYVSGDIPSYIAWCAIFNYRIRDAKMIATQRRHTESLSTGACTGWPQRLHLDLPASSPSDNESRSMNEVGDGRRGRACVKDVDDRRTGRACRRYTSRVKTARTIITRV